MQDEYIKPLLDKYKAGTISDAEKAVLDKWYLHVAADSSEELSVEQRLQTFDTVLAHLEEVSKPVTRRLWPRIAAAASIIVALSAGGYFLLKKEAPKQVMMVQNDIAPGRNQATLTLANGQRIVLTANMSGKVATQGQTNIQAGNGQLAYQATSKENTVSYNSVSTAKGEQLPFPLVLADGTKVWLNAESKITYPTAFNGMERIVKLTGEAYFEVKHNAAQPFKVQTEKQTIEDIGTAFNVNAYANEKAITTTLIEGSVKVNHLTLKPGQQTDGSNVTAVNTGQYIAWKNGDFDFENNDIKNIMRQLERWYDIEVVYQGQINDLGFYANISRTRNISALLKALERTKHIHFKIEGRRVIVSQ